MGSGYCGDGLVQAPNGVGFNEECDTDDAVCKNTRGSNFACNYNCGCFDAEGFYGGVLKIPDIKIAAGNQVEQAQVVVLYNHASDGLAASAGDIGNFQSVSIDDRVLSQAELQSCDCFTYGGEPGVFILNLTSSVLGLLSPELPEGSYRVKAVVMENNVFYSANAPHAVIVQRQETALPESDLLVIAFFALLALFFVRRGRIGERR